VTLRIFEVAPGFAFAEFPTPEDLPALMKWDALMTLSKRRPSPEVVAHFKEYRYWHMPDGKEIPVEAVGGAVAIIVRWLAEGRYVIIHCYGGRNRSGLVAAEVLMKLNGITGKRALEVIDGASQKRNGQPRALVNPYFRAYLEALKGGAP
jgi:protein-tyrosine phosphatase